MLTSQDLQKTHARFVLTPWSAQRTLNPPVIVRGEGVYIYDADGKRYLDLCAGLIAVNLGHGHPKVVRAIAEQAARLCYAPTTLFCDVRAQLAEELAALSPWNDGARVFFTTGGGEANEDATKMARMVTGRQKVLAAYRSFHGSAPGAGSLTGEDRRWPVEPGIPGVVHFFTPYPYRSPFHAKDPKEEVRRALDHLELVLTHEGPSRVAAIILEPVVGTNGAIVYPDGYLAGVREICNRHGILLVFDEVMTGFGRVGASFAAERFGVAPDLLSFAKGVASAYIPLGGVLVRESVASHFDRNVLWCGHTYSGHPLAMAAGLAAVRAYREEKIFERVGQIEQWLRQGLSELARKHVVIGDVRGVGALFALELVKDRETKEPLVPMYAPGPALMPELVADLRRRGVYAFGRYNVLLVTPPLVIEKSELDEGIAALDGALAELSRSGRL